MKLLLMRKQILTAALFFICCAQASAQLEKGNLYPNISSEFRFKQFYKDYGVKTGLSYALDKHNLIGISYNYMKSNKYQSFFDQNTKSYGSRNGIGVAYNYFHYFKNSKKLGWYVNANLDYNRISVYDIKSTGETRLNNRYNEFELSVRPGLFFKPSDKFILHANIGGFSIVNAGGNISGPLTFGSQLNVGVLINLDFFRKRK
jgi:hypothetical protein